MGTCKIIKLHERKKIDANLRKVLWVQLDCNKIYKQKSDNETLNNEMWEVYGSAKNTRTFRIYLLKIAHKKLSFLEVFLQNKLIEFSSGHLFFNEERELVLTFSVIDMVLGFAVFNMKRYVSQ